MIASLLLASAGCSDDADDDATNGMTGMTSVETSAMGTTDADETGAPDGTTGGVDETSADETGPLAVDYEADVQPIWNGNCLCHMQNDEGVMQAPVLTLNADLSFGELVGTASEQLPSMDRVTPAQPEESYLWHKLQGTHLDVGGMGDSMPQVGQLQPDALAVIEAWIAAGAEP